MPHLLQTAIAVALLIGLPLFVPTPESDWGILGAIVVALLLVAVAVRGVVRFVRSRKPKTYLDRIMPEKPPAPKVTIMDKPTDN